MFYTCILEKVTVYNTDSAFSESFAFICENFVFTRQSFALIPEKYLFFSAKINLICFRKKTMYKEYLKKNNLHFEFSPFVS